MITVREMEAEDDEDRAPSRRRRHVEVTEGIWIFILSCKCVHSLIKNLFFQKLQLHQLLLELLLDEEVDLHYEGPDKIMV